MAKNISADQAHYLFSIADEKFGVLGFHSYEGISTLSRLELRLVSENPEIDFAKMVDKPAILTMALTDYGVERYIHGMVNCFEQRDQHNRFTVYHATVIPALWYLTKRINCRIFQFKSAQDIIELILKEAIPGLLFEFKLNQSPSQRDYCVQYQESDLDFISRLLEEEGIFYFFEHSEAKPKLIFADGSFAHPETPNNANIIFHSQVGGQGYTEEHIQQLYYSEQSVSNKVTLRDYNFKHPFSPEGESSAPGSQSELEIYHYPGRFDDAGKANKFASIRLEEQQTKQKQAKGSSFCVSLTPGHYFDLESHPRDSLNQRYLLTELNLHVEQPQALKESGGGEAAENIFDSQFECIPFSTPYRPARVTPRPKMYGSQTATVVGPKGEEIYSEKYATVKVQFHWDREGLYNEHSSCWIRVSQAWAGIGWGGINIPRIGQEVIVDFLEDDPDCPIITGKVYNGKHTTPYSLPADQTRSTIKTNSSPGGQGYNEIRFEDKKGSEQLYLHAEKDYDLRIKNNRREHVTNDFSLIVKKDLKQLVEEQKNVTIKKDNRLHVDGNEYHHVGKDLHQKISKNYHNSSGLETHFKAGQKIVIHAGMDITIKAGGSFIRLNPSGVTISGAMIKINSGGSAASVKGAQSQTPSQPQEADTAKPGEQYKEPAAPVVWKAKKVDISNLQAQRVTLKTAAASGTPFCEVCQ